MNLSVERLRFWLLVGAGLLVTVIAGFLGYAHYRAHRFLTNLPKKLGVDIRSETNGYTYSQSSQGKTIYTIHAAKAVEHLDGKTTLHDVGIVLYGRNQDRADRIYGKEFEYDSKNQVIRADGEVHIDLEAPEAASENTKANPATGKDAHPAGTASPQQHKDPRLIHVTTSGLVFLQKLGIAATEKDIEFESGGLTGHAIGADYNSDTGVIVLHSAVKVNGLQHEKPTLLTASRAELDRPNRRVLLTQAKYVTVGESGQTAQGQHVVVHLRPDGTAERVEAEGDVSLTSGTNGTVSGPHGEMTLNAQNQPQTAVMTGGVKYALNDPLRQAQGEASQGRAAFDKVGHPERIVISGSVHFHERVRPSDAADEPWSERELNAATVELALAADAAGKAHLHDAKGTGGARLQVVNIAGKAGSQQKTSSSLAGDVLTAHFVRIGNTDHISEVHGDGHTVLRRTNAKGVVNTSSGDSLVAQFRPAAAGTKSASGAAKAPGQGADEVSGATEQGHVVMTQLPIRKPGDATPPAEERATAERAVYDGELERTTLTGNVQVTDGTSILWADRVVSEQESGDSTADGSVKATYGQPNSADEPVHIQAARAEMKRDTQVAIFYGNPGKAARLWQGTSQVDAPVLQFERKQKRLLAHGAGQGAPLAVHTVLVGNASTPGGKTGPSGKTSPAGKKTDVIRIASRDLVYSDEVRRADFTGGIEVESADGKMRGQQAIAYLLPSQATGKANSRPSTSGSGFMGGSVDHIVATGHIEMDQPGRRATGEQVVYTAGDGMFVLTGTPSTLPRVIDDRQGTVTGPSLQFHAGDGNVVVSNGASTDAGQRVHTETRVKNKP